MADLSIGKRVAKATFTQDLSAGALNVTTSFGFDTCITSITFHFSANPGNEDLNISLNNDAGANYDTLLFTQQLNNTTDLFWQPDQPLILRDGDELDIDITNGGTPSSTVYVTVIGEEA